MNVVGLGTQDNLEFAEEFISTTGTSTLPMYWEDGGFDSWSFYGVRGQPAAILVTADGTIIDGWSGRFPLDTVLELAQANA